MNLETTKSNPEVFIW